MMERRLLLLGLVLFLVEFAECQSRPLTISFPNTLIYENAGNATIEITRLSGSSSLTVGVEIIPQTAVINTDYTPPSNTVTFVGASLTTNITMSVVDRMVVGNDKTFKMRINDSSNVLEAVFTILNALAKRPFDCRRPGQECNSTTDICHHTAPICQCSDSLNRQGASCDIQTSTINGAGCPGSCSNNSVCTSIGGSPVCACDPGYYGTNCDIKYVSVECFRGGMTVFFNPLGTFGGLIYLKNKLNVGACHAIPLPPTPRTGISDRLQGYYITLDHDNATCGNVTPVETGPITSYIRDFIIQYSTMIITGRDQILSAHCYFDNANQTVTSGNISVNPDLSTLENSTTSNIFSPVQITVTRGKGGPPLNISAPVPLKTQVCIILSVRPELGGIEIRDITFNNSSPVSPVTWSVYTSGCQHKDYRTISFLKPEYLNSPSKRSIQFCFETFTFNSPRTTVTTEIILSTCVNPADCNLLTCARGKRAISEVTERQVEVTLTIYDPSITQGNGETSGGRTCTGLECQPTVIAVALGSAAAGMLLLLPILLFCCLRKKQKKQKKPVYWS